MAKRYELWCLMMTTLVHDEQLAMIVKAIFYRHHAIVSIMLKIVMISIIRLHCPDIISLIGGRRIVHSKNICFDKRLELTAI